MYYFRHMAGIPKYLASQATVASIINHRKFCAPLQLCLREAIKQSFFTHLLLCHWLSVNAKTMHCYKELIIFSYAIDIFSCNFLIQNSQYTSSKMFLKESKIIYFTNVSWQSCYYRIIDLHLLPNQESILEVIEF